MSTQDAQLPVAPRLDGDAPHLLVIRAPYYRNVIDGMTDGVRARLASLAGLDVGEGDAGSPGECARAAARRRAQEANQRLAQLPRELRVAVHATRQPDSTYLIDAVARAAKAATPAASEAA